jgi:UDP-N-acetyl-D-galactosamine dehydrogenase
MINKKISVVGLGYVGSEIFKKLAKNEKYVFGYDINPEQFKNLTKYQNISSNINILDNSKYIFICIDTPIKKKKPDLSNIVKFCKSTNKFILKGATIIIESSFSPETVEKKIIPLIEKFSKLKMGKNFQVAYSPERISPSDTISFQKIIKVVSAKNNNVLKNVNNLYKKILDKTITTNKIKEAEMSKIFENTQRDMNIAITNQLFMLCKKMELDFEEILKLCSTKWNFQKYEPGLVGGHCIPVDPYYLYDYAKKNKFNFSLIPLSRKINDQFIKWTADTLLNKLKKIPNKKILIVGQTYKNNVTDKRNSGAIKIYKLIKKKYKNTSTYDAELNEYPKFKKEYNVIIYLVNHNSNFNKKNPITNYISNDKAYIFDVFNKLEKKFHSRVKIIK